MPTRPPITWDAPSGRYRLPNGRYVSRAGVEDALRAAVTQAAQRFDTLASALAERRITLAEWQTQTRIALRDVHAYSAAIPVGGLQQMTPQAWGAVGRQLRDQYARLTGLAADVAAGRVPLDGRFRQRMRLYGLSGRVTFEAAALRDQMARGFDLEFNVRGKFDSCAGCLAATAAGEVPSGTLVPPGLRDCLGNCGCRVRRKNSQTGEVAA